MKKQIFALILLLILSPSFSIAGYREMKKEVEEYQPPRYLLRYHDKTEETSDGSRLESFSDFSGKVDKKRQMPSFSQKEFQFDSKDVFFRSAPSDALRHAAGNSRKVLQTLHTGFSLETLDALILLRNPKIRAAEKNVTAENESYSQALNLDEILIQYSAFTESLMNKVGPMKSSEAVKNNFPFPAVSALKSQVVTQSVKAARQELEIVRRDMLTEGRKTYWNLLFVHKAQAITAETLDLFNRLKDVANSRYKSGKTSFQDVIKITIRVNILEEELVTLNEKRENLKIKILELIDLPSGAAIGDPADRKAKTVSLPLEKLYRIGRIHRQELKKMRAKIGKMERMVEMAETMIIPPYSLELSYFEDEAVMQAGPGAVKPTFAVNKPASMGAGLPKMPWFGTNDAWLRQTRERLYAKRQELKAAESATDNQVRNAWFNLDKALREARLYRDSVVDLSRSALDVSTRGYESGNVSFADVIESYSGWLTARLKLAGKESDIGVACAELSRSVGKSL